MIVRNFRRVNDDTLSLRVTMGYFDVTVQVVSSSEGEKVKLPQGIYIPDKEVYNDFVKNILYHWSRCIEFEKT